MTDIDTLLRQRAEPPANPGLAGRIAAKAQTTPQKRRAPLWSFVPFRLPAPAYAYATALMLGLFIGIGTPVLDENAAEGQADDNPFTSEETLL